MKNASDGAFIPSSSKVLTLYASLTYHKSLFDQQVIARSMFIGLSVLVFVLVLLQLVSTLSFANEENQYQKNFIDFFYACTNFLKNISSNTNF